MFGHLGMWTTNLLFYCRLMQSRCCREIRNVGKMNSLWLGAMGGGGCFVFASLTNFPFMPTFALIGPLPTLGWSVPESCKLQGVCSLEIESKLENSSETDSAMGIFGSAPLVSETRRAFGTSLSGAVFVAMSGCEREPWIVPDGFRWRPCRPNPWGFLCSSAAGGRWFPVGSRLDGGGSCTISDPDDLDALLEEELDDFFDDDRDRDEEEWWLVDRLWDGFDWERWIAFCLSFGLLVYGLEK